MTREGQGNVPKPIQATQELTTHREAPSPVVSADMAFISMVERLATDPAADVAKVEKALEMRERVMLRQAETAFNESLSAVQRDMRPVAADAANPQTKSKYASFAALDRALRPLYTTHGFALSFDTGDGAPEGHVRVLCYVSRGSYTRTYRADMPADGKGAKGGDVMSKTHAAGSAFTYGARYLLKMIFNVAVGADWDDDGNTAGRTIEGEANGTLSTQQLGDLRQKIVESGIDIAKVTAFAHVETLDEIPARHFQKVLSAIEQYAQKAAKK